MRGLGRGTGAVVDTELQAGIRVHVGVRGEPTWSKHDGPRTMQCPLSRGPRRPRGPRFSGTPGSNAGTPPLSALRLQCNKRTPRPVVESSTPLPLLISRGMPPPTRAMPWHGQRDGLAPRYRTRAGG